MNRLDGTVLLLSGTDDHTTEAVNEALRRLGAKVARMDAGDFPQSMTLVAKSAESGTWSGRLVSTQGSIEFHVAARVGLTTPRTLVTNDYTALRDFAAEIDGPLVCKQMSALVLYDHGKPRLTYTTRVEVADVSPTDLAVTANQFQEVPKAREAWVIMVGERPLAVAIQAESDESYVDWLPAASDGGARRGRCPGTGAVRPYRRHRRYLRRAARLD
ncbi:MAG TPA: hypothetical protein VLJ59_19890 [Mycobacteriales bacterium]|nr:hypothetical protein [Mycobacteriales bacterium]